MSIKNREGAHLIGIQTGTTVKAALDVRHNNCATVQCKP